MFDTRLKLKVPYGLYPEQRERQEGWLDLLVSRMTAPLARRIPAGQHKFQRLTELVNQCADMYRGSRESQIGVEARVLRLRLRREGFREDLVAHSFALVREASQRTLGQRHYDVQIMGGWVLMNGMLAEMETGEGKTLTATLPVCTAALAGIPVHIITVNDYLAKRDAENMGPIYRAMGLTVGSVTHGMDSEARRAAYACDVTYCTNKELVFDYLRDQLVLGAKPNPVQLSLDPIYGGRARTRKILLRGLCFVIVDEADSVLIDEARTPLILSGNGSQGERLEPYQVAMEIADQLQSVSDFALETQERSVRLTSGGQGRIEEIVQTVDVSFKSRLQCHELVKTALAARYIYHKDQHYLVHNGEIRIIDEYTGRAMAGRSWEHGLHQLIEFKEGCKLTSQHEPQGRITYQRFFRRYLRLAGMTGTAQEVAGELWSVYRLVVVPIPTHRITRRAHHQDRIYTTVEEKWKKIVERISSLHQDGRPVLIGTRSVAASEHLSRILEKASLPHKVLNARQDGEEAEIIKRAGERGQITVATNMAGRGTDICLAPGVAGIGGLHVIATERNDARRVDRQLFGRCARQGDSGSYEAIISFEDELLRFYGGFWRMLGGILSHPGRTVPFWIGSLAVQRSQYVAESRHRRLRRQLLKMDGDLDTVLAFTGRRE